MCLVAWGSICSPAAHLGLGPVYFIGFMFSFWIEEMHFKNAKNTF